MADHRLFTVDPLSSFASDLNPREINRQFNGWSERFLEAYGLDLVNRDELEFYIQFDRFFWGD